MGWIKDAAWQQGLAILLVVAGAVLIYRGAAATGELAGIAPLGVVLFGCGIALPLISQALRVRRENAARSEDV